MGIIYILEGELDYNMITESNYLFCVSEGCYEKRLLDPSSAYLSICERCLGVNFTKKRLITVCDHFGILYRKSWNKKTLVLAITTHFKELKVND